MEPKVSHSFLVSNPILPQYEFHPFIQSTNQPIIHSFIRFSFPLSYLSSYDVRVSTKDNSVQLTYYGAITNNTQEDWKNVSPSPFLYPLILTYWILVSILFSSHITPIASHPQVNLSLSTAKPSIGGTPAKLFTLHVEIQPVIAYPSHFGGSYSRSK